MKRYRLWFLGQAAVVILGTTAAWADRIPEYANDLGPATIDVSKYPADKQQGYELMQAKCMRCHTVARVVNSEFITDKEWGRYIKRMAQRPPCCNQCPVITHKDAKAIWEFLVYDSRIRKTGSNAANWKQLHQALLQEFKSKYPKQYEQRYENIKGDNIQ